MKKLLYILSILVLVSCGTAKLPGEEKKIIFGVGGGFTGIPNTYLLSSYGKLYKIKMNGDIEATYNIKFGKKELITLFNTSAFLQKKYMGFANPGNIYYFLNLSGDFGSNPQFTWGQDGFKVPDDVLAFYNLLNIYVPKGR